MAVDRFREFWIRSCFVILLLDFWILIVLLLPVFAFRHDERLFVVCLIRVVAVEM